MIAPKRYGLHSLRLKLVLASVAVEAVMLTVLVWNSVRITDNALNETFLRRVHTLVPLMNASLAEPLVQRDYATLDERLEAIVNQKSLVYVEVSDELGQVTARHGAVPEKILLDTTFDSKDGIYNQAFDIQIAGRVIGHARFGLNTGLLQATLSNLRTQGMLLALIEIAISLLLLATLGYLLTRHLKTLAQAAQTIQDGDYSVRVTATGRDEVAVTARAFNAMAQTVEHDIATREHTEQELRASVAHFRAIFESAADGIFIASNTGHYTDVNSQGCRMLGYTLEELLTFAYDHVIVEEQKPLAAMALANINAGVVTQSQWLLRHKDGMVFPVEINMTALPDGGYLGIVRDITERKRAEVELDRLAYSDALTDLPNRTSLLKGVVTAIQQAQIGGTTLAILLMDLNNFREINDTLGHHNGDKVLIEVANRLRTALWDSDIVARLGGDEFAVLLPHLADQIHINLVVTKILDALTPELLIEGVPLDIQTAMGIALYPEHGLDADTLMQHADVALYSAKAKHLTHVIYNSDTDHYNPQQLALMGELRLALERDELVLHYQPVVNLATGHMIGVEALVRWQHPGRGLLFPDTFIPAAEKTGLIGPLTTWVLSTALRQQQQWQKNGITLNMSVNLSVRNLQQTDLVQEVEDTLLSFGVAPECLTLEITESAIMDDPDRAKAVLTELHDLGIRFAIDDFGIGHSSLAYLKHLPVSKMKVDKSFIMDFKDPANAAIVKTTIELAHNLGLTVTAEGVEDADALQALKLLNCNHAQGYYLSRPQPIDKLELWMRESPWGLST